MGECLETNIAGREQTTNSRSVIRGNPMQKTEENIQKSWKKVEWKRTETPEKFQRTECSGRCGDCVARLAVLV